MLNKVIIMGRLTRDPEIRTTGSGISVCSFTVAVDNGYGDNRQTDFINCVAWRNQADFLGKYFTKGMMVIVAGRISTRSWEGQDGRKNYSTEVIANEINFGETKKAREANSGLSSGGYEPQSRNQYSSYSEPKSNSYAAQQSSMPADLGEDEFLPISEVDDDLPF